MHDLLRVHVLERLARLAYVLDRAVERQAGRAALLQHRVQIGPFDKGHDEVLTALVLEVVEHLDHAWMAQLREQSRLHVKALRVASVLHVLDRDGAVGLRVPRAIDGAHGPTGDRPFDRITVRQHERWR